MAKVEVVLSLEVDNNWIEFITKESDIFMTNYCGYWMFGMERDPNLGWLVFEHDDSKTLRQVAEHPEYASIVALWRAGKPLPAKWYRLNHESAVQAWVAGVKLFGTGWYEHPNSDASTYDTVVQMALLGDIVYG